MIGKELDAATLVMLIIRQVQELHAEPFMLKSYQITPTKFHKGITLKNYLEQRMNIGKFLLLRQRVINTIKDLHEKYGLAHGDLHHQNIIILPDTMEARLIDYGVAGPIDTIGKNSTTRKGYSIYNDLLVPESYFVAYAKKHYSKTNPGIITQLQANLENLYDRHMEVIPADQRSARVGIQNKYYTRMVAKEYSL
jgi:RIO-like serine/threonine protein kinase